MTPNWSRAGAYLESPDCEGFRASGPEMTMRLNDLG